MANQTLEFQGLRILVIDNADGTFSLRTYSGGAGVADQSIEIQGNRMLMHDNGDGTYSPVTTASTGASDSTLEHDGLRLKIHPTGLNDAQGHPTFAFVTA